MLIVVLDNVAMITDNCEARCRVCGLHTHDVLELHPHSGVLWWTVLELCCGGCRKWIEGMIFDGVLVERTQVGPPFADKNGEGSKT